MAKKYWILILIVAFGFFIRSYKITEKAMYGDELTMVYDTYSILRTGHDATGQKLPLTFKMGAGRPGGYIYASLPFVAVFGPTALGVRALSLLSGVGVILLIYLLARKLFDERVAMIAAALSAVSPWEIYLSRAGFEAHFALFLALLGVVAFIYAKTKPRLYIVWAIAWGLCVHTYPTFKLTLPAFALPMFWYMGEPKKLIAKKVFLLGVVILAFFAILGVRETLVGGSEERFTSINILNDKDTYEAITQRINQERNISTLPASLKPIFHNRPLEYAQILLESHIRNISNEFLFISGDGNPRHNPGEMGMLYLVELPLIFIALLFIWQKNKRELLLIAAWIVIVPMATMFLSDEHGLRNAFLIPPFVLLSAYALSRLPRKVALLAAAILVIQMVMILQRLYFLVPSKFANFWSYSALAASEIANKEKSNYEKVYISKRIDNVEYAYPTYNAIDPWIVIGQCNSVGKVFDNVIIEDIDAVDFKGSRALVIADANKDDIEGLSGRKINSVNLEPALFVYEIGE